MPYGDEFSQRLRRIRKECGLTQKVVAELLGVDRSTYAYYETGKTSPDPTTLARLASLFRVSADLLLGRDTDPPELHDELFLLGDSVVRRFSELSESEQLLVLQFRVLSHEQRKTLFAQLQQGVERSVPSSAPSETP